MGGYGIFMTKSIMDDIQYSDRGNVVVMTKLFASAKREPDAPADQEQEQESGGEPT
jgi:anti-sigma regulatory factor (Ser/Thr protein kinase)